MHPQLIQQIHFSTYHKIPIARSLSYSSQYPYSGRKNSGFKWSTKFRNQQSSKETENQNYQQNSNQQNNNQDTYKQGFNFEEEVSEEAQNNANAEYFTPQKKLIFVKNRSRIYEYTLYSKVKKGYLILLFGCGLMTYFLINKLVNFKERSYFGLFFYGCLLLVIAPRITGLAGIFNKMIKQIDLCKNGKQIIIQHGKLGIFHVESKFDIAKISKPVDAQEGIKLQFAFPLTINGNVYFLPREQHEINKEVLPQVLNGRYIDIQEAVEEIIITTEDQKSDSSNNHK